MAMTIFDLARCWRVVSQFGQRCPEKVDPEDMLGLCPDHIEEMREW